MTSKKGPVWRGVEDLRPHLVPLGSLSPHPANPKDHDLGAIASSLARFGQQVPILVQRSTGWIVAGNGRWESIPMVAELETALDVGPGEPWTHVAAIFTDMDDLQAKAYALADNRSHDLGGYHEDRLAALLSELAATGDLTATGYDEDDLDNLLAALRPRVPDDVAGMTDPTLRSEVVVEIRCSRAFLESADGGNEDPSDTIREILVRWGEEEGVEVSIA